MKRLFFLPLFFTVLISFGQIFQPQAPDKIYGDLFTEVQMQRIFEDGKTFVDCIPKRKPADIMYDYGMQKGPNFNLKKFVEDNFEVPQPAATNYKTDRTQLS